MNIDKKYMDIAIGLARKAEGRTNPNPLVGAVIVKGGRIVGRGYHKKCGLPHAEACAIKSSGDLARGATLYVTLEPCDHHGRTPPCTDAIIKSGIKRVVIAMKDPNPVTDGRGIKKLKRHGIKVETGILESEASAINKPFIKFITKRMPWVRVKMAESIDGKIATKSGDSKWITTDESRRYVRCLRGKVDAVMVGINTVLKDDPLLLSGIPGLKEPLRVVVDSALRIPVTSKLFSTSGSHSVLLATTKKASFKKAEACAKKGISVLFCKAKGGRVDLMDLLRKLSWLNITDLLVEGGGELTASFIEQKLVDQFIFFIAPKIIGGRDARTAVEGRGVDKVKDALKLKNVSTRILAGDILIEAEADQCLQA
ncbi:MAG: bifunctional diaminohydroxyphosphoribosylaminopyrimidine deaminase/5-amino-6-(5-phosphoribosylamino)uracil reductase RibD [Candidatus Omnitrophica bacterium]|nr:bifunctional diaminohydroxyphosphoribosylaminopyrimidine deaminase/5-amino-6-(5-phosphoribosylamino)uracil reductase RibD [Candidatus Omnitrophota bacterium]